MRNSICLSVSASSVLPARHGKSATAPTLTDYERLEFERVRAEINAGLDGETFDRLSSEGAAMPIADATAFALAGFL